MHIPSRWSTKFSITYMRTTIGNLVLAYGTGSREVLMAHRFNSDLEMSMKYIAVQSEGGYRALTCDLKFVQSYQTK